MNINYSTRPGISMAETVVSTLLVGFVLMGSLQIVGPLIRSNTHQSDRLFADHLANEMTHEISTKLYMDPTKENRLDLGVEPDETLKDRTTFDDVDDFHGWTANPPVLSGNQSLDDMKAWTRSVVVTHVNVDDPTTPSLTETGLKRVVVSVSKNGVVLSSISSLHSKESDKMAFGVVWDEFRD